MVNTNEGNRAGEAGHQAGRGGNRSPNVGEHKIQDSSGAGSLYLHWAVWVLERRGPPHPDPMTSQVPHESVAQQETNAARFVVPKGEGVPSAAPDASHHW